MKEAYYAGLFDGEGFVSFLYNPSNRQWYTPIVGITMLDEDVLLDAQQYWGGTISLQENRYTHWRVTGLKAKPFIEAILPFAQLKKDRLLAVLEILETYEGMRGRYMTSDIIDKRKRIVERVRQQQDKGRVSYTDGMMPGTI